MTLLTVVPLVRNSASAFENVAICCVLLAAGGAATFRCSLDCHCHRQLFRPTLYGGLYDVVDIQSSLLTIVL
eukprot:834993-Amphidinium_carterae.1